jgi:hypothetical protein
MRRHIALTKNTRDSSVDWLERDESNGEAVERIGKGLFHESLHLKKVFALRHQPTKALKAQSLFHSHPTAPVQQGYV